MIKKKKKLNKLETEEKFSSLIKETWNPHS